jgi:putative GTP pyrophosphokinase
MQLSGGEARVIVELRAAVDKELCRVGLAYRLFSRVKEALSMDSKIARKGYRASGPLMRDLFGLRVVLYFPDDVPLVATALDRVFERVESTVDHPTTELFAPQRHNIVYRLPPALRHFGIDWDTAPVDATFELQLRTVLSEGWHEVEHDLRYKWHDDWVDNRDLARVLNGALATVETCEWAMQQLFEELAWRHYKNARWSAMLRAKLRIRLQAGELGEALDKVFREDGACARQIFRTPRKDLLGAIASHGISLPLTLDNVCYVMGRLAGDTSIRQLEPRVVTAELDRCLGARTY